MSVHNCWSKYELSLLEDLIDWGLDWFIKTNNVLQADVRPHNVLSELSDTEENL